MLSIRLPLAVILAIIVGLAAFAVSIGLNLSAYEHFVSPVAVIIYLLLQMLATKFTVPASEKQDEAVKSRTSPSKSRNTNDVIPQSSEVSTLYVGNLAYKANEMTVKELFSQYGNVISVRLMKDKKTNRRKGFGFVEIEAGKEEVFIKALNDSEFMDRTLKVRPAKEKSE
uniref:RNA-binding protein n=1 Tax=Ningiella ruwaisensis TaxID=2364274 RepID=UPI0015D256C7|nr:RNA-binding protein [Ningiella ruwaisensis]